MKKARTILTRKGMRTILNAKKQHLQTLGFVQSSVCILSSDGLVYGYEFDEFPSNLAERRSLFLEVGNQLRQEGIMVEEALAAAGGWIVEGPRFGLKVPPSRQSQRRAAIFIGGRNAAKTRTAYAIQPFRQDKQGVFHWEKAVLESRKAAPSEQPLHINLIDILFLGLQGNHY